MEVSVANPQSVAPLAPNQVLDANASQPPGFVQRVMALPAQRKLMLGGGIAAIVAIFVAMMLWGRTGDYRVLYTNLSDKDGGAILAQLQQMQVPYKHADGGAAILVPSDKVHDVRLKLASAGLPKGSVVGFELMENQKFGTTQFQERLNFQRGLEGELTRSIQAISSVQSARVHLALPNQNGFFREQQKPSASVVLTLYTGRSLDRGQIAGIVHLVSSSVPEMSPKAVSIVDQTGALLSGPQEGVDHAGLDAQQLLGQRAAVHRPQRHGAVLELGVHGIAHAGQARQARLLARIAPALAVQQRGVERHEQVPARFDMAVELVDQHLRGLRVHRVRQDDAGNARPVAAVAQEGVVGHGHDRQAFLAGGVQPGLRDRQLARRLVGNQQHDGRVFGARTRIERGHHRQQHQRHQQHPHPGRQGGQPPDHGRPPVPSACAGARLTSQEYSATNTMRSMTAPKHR